MPESARTASNAEVDTKNFLETAAKFVTVKQDSDVNTEESISFATAESIRRNQLHFDMAMIDARRHANDSHLQSTRMFRNGEGNDKDSAQQQSRIADVAADNHWNLNEQTLATVITTAVLAALGQDKQAAA